MGIISRSSGDSSFNICSILSGKPSGIENNTCRSACASAFSILGRGWVLYGGMVDAMVSKTIVLWACQFDSGLRHQFRLYLCGVGPPPPIPGILAHSLHIPFVASYLRLSEFGDDLPRPFTAVSLITPPFLSRSNTTPGPVFGGRVSLGGGSLERSALRKGLRGPPRFRKALNAPEHWQDTTEVVLEDPSDEA